MVDTVVLKSKSFEVMSNSDLTVQPAARACRLDGLDIDAGLFLFQDSKGRNVYGSKAYVNSDVFQATIYNGRLTGFVPLLKIQSSLPKACLDARIQKKSNFLPANDSDIDKALTRIQDQLSDAGIDVDVLSMDVQRLDVCRNIELDNAFDLYTSMFSLMSCKRKPNKKQYGQDTFSFQNTLSEVEIYNKLKEMRHNKIPIPVGYSEKNNIARVEIRMKKANEVGRLVGVNKAGSLLHGSDDLLRFHKRYMRENVFNYSSNSDCKEKIDNVNGFIQEFLNADSPCQVRNRHGYLRFIECFGLDAVECAYRARLASFGKTEKQINDTVRSYKKKVIAGSLALNGVLSDLYSEFREKLVA